MSNDNYGRRASDRSRASRLAVRVAIVCGAAAAGFSAGQNIPTPAQRGEGLVVKVGQVVVDKPIVIEGQIVNKMTPKH